MDAAARPDGERGRIQTGVEPWGPPMVEFGYHLSCEEHPPNDLVRYARRAEALGFSFALISDHYLPWIDRQGNAPFVWCVIGGIAQATTRLRLGTAVTCPLIRIQPPIIAQAAATAACMMPGRFFLGVGTGEALNEHILGDHWPPISVRQDMLDEAVDILRLLWGGGMQSFFGQYYTVENARIYTLPEQPPDIYVAAAGPVSAGLAGRIGDGFMSTVPKAELVQAFDSAGGAGKPRYAQITVCWGRSAAEAKRIACEWWPTLAIPGELGSELSQPAYFEQVSQLVTEGDIAKLIACGPDPEQHVKAITEFIDAGFDHVAIHQIGPDQDGFFDFYAREVLPKLAQQEQR